MTSTTRARIALTAASVAAGCALITGAVFAFAQPSTPELPPVAKPAVVDVTERESGVPEAPTAEPAADVEASPSRTKEPTEERAPENPPVKADQPRVEAPKQGVRAPDAPKAPSPPKAPVNPPAPPVVPPPVVEPPLAPRPATFSVTNGANYLPGGCPGTTFVAETHGVGWWGESLIDGNKYGFPFTVIVQGGDTVVVLGCV